MRNKIKAALVAVASAGILAAIPAPAHAALTDCSVGYFCWWTGTNYSGTRYSYNKATIDAGYRHGIRLGSLATNQADSWYNHTTVAINIYDDGACGYSPWTRTLSSGQYATSQGSDWKSRMSSFQITSYAPNC